MLLARAAVPPVVRSGAPVRSCGVARGGARRTGAWAAAARRARRVHAVRGSPAPPSPAGRRVQRRLRRGPRGTASCRCTARSTCPTTPGVPRDLLVSPGAGAVRAREGGPATVGFLICSEIWAMERAHRVRRPRRATAALAAPDREGRRSTEWLAAGKATALLAGAYSLSSNRMVARRGVRRPRLGRRPARGRCSPRRARADRSRPSRSTCVQPTARRRRIRGRCSDELTGPGRE